MHHTYPMHTHPEEAMADTGHCLSERPQQSAPHHHYHHHTPLAGDIPGFHFQPCDQDPKSSALLAVTGPLPAAGSLGKLGSPCLAQVPHSLWQLVLEQS